MTLPDLRFRLSLRSAPLGRAPRAFAGALALLLLAATPSRAALDRFYFGNDLSYVNQMEDCGAVYREGGAAKDPFRIFAEHGTNLVRVRLWNDPWWQPLIPQTAPGAKPQYSDLPDAIKTITRAKTHGMQVLLDIHFSDFWADAGRQAMPRAWSGFANDDAQLEAAVYDWVRHVLGQLEQRGLMPELVQIGNETNPGMVMEQTLNAAWNGATQRLDVSTGGVRRTDNTHFARMLKAGIRGVRDAGAASAIKPKVVLHQAGHNSLVTFLDWMQQIGVTDFDVIGLSYYYAWHGGSITAAGNAIRAARTKYPAYDVMIVETGYPWDGANIDGMNNIISELDPAYSPASPAMQRSYLVALTQEVINAGGRGVVFWESAWVSTPARTPWGVGSAHEHVAFFDHRNQLNFHAGGTWTEANYTGLANTPTVAVPPKDFHAPPGATATFRVLAQGPGPLAYQWRRNGAAIAGATSATLTLANVQLADAANFSVTVSNAEGSVTSTAAALVVGTSAGRVPAISMRARVGTGSEILVPGLVVGGSTPQNFLIRALGPKLNDFGIPPGTFLADPLLKVTLIDGTVIAQNDDWGTNANAAAIVTTAATLGAQALTAGSKDAVLLTSLAPGVYTPQISGVGATTGVSLVEFYNVDAGNKVPAISMRARVGTGSEILVPGLVVEGSAPKMFLIRALGPKLGDFGIPPGTFLADPLLKITLIDGTVIAQNDNWEDGANVALIPNLTTNLGAQPLSAGSKDAVLLIALPPGVYTPQISGVANSTGVCLVEFYNVE